MIIKKLKLKNYRNHEDIEQEFDQKLTLITGDNGSGKTNILEAVALLSTAKPFKAQYDKETIMHGEVFSKAEGTVVSNGDLEETKLEVTILAKENSENITTKTVKVNGLGKRQRDFSTNFNTVLFSPEDINLLTGSPSKRRQYIDTVLSQLDLKYKRAMIDYVKAVRQRNKVLELLSEHKTGQNQIEFWDGKVLETGKVIQEKREEFFDFIKVKLYSHGKEIENAGDFILKYNANLVNKERIGLYKQKEIAARRTLIGPHRDDFEIHFDSFDIAHYGSRGQQRAAIISLKLAEIDYFEKVTERRPVLLLDDIFSELDDEHENSIIETIGKQQTIITSTEVPENIADFKHIELGL